MQVLDAIHLQDAIRVAGVLVKRHKELFRDLLAFLRTRLQQHPRDLPFHGFPVLRRLPLDFLALCVIACA